MIKKSMFFFLCIIMLFSLMYSAFIVGAAEPLSIKSFRGESKILTGETVDLEATLLEDII